MDVLQRQLAHGGTIARFLMEGNSVDNYKPSNLIERLVMSFLFFWASGLDLEMLHIYPTCCIYSRPPVPDTPSMRGRRASPAETYILIDNTHLDTRKHFS